MFLNVIIMLLMAAVVEMHNHTQGRLAGDVVGARRHYRGIPSITRLVVQVGVKGERAVMVGSSLCPRLMSPVNGGGAHRVGFNGAAQLTNWRLRKMQHTRVHGVGSTPLRGVHVVQLLMMGEVAFAPQDDTR